MGFWSSVCSFASSACSAIGGAISAVVSTISPALGLGLEVIKAVANVAQTVLTVLGILKPEERIEELGDRVQQASETGITPEKYEKFDHYVRHSAPIKSNFGFKI